LLDVAGPSSFTGYDEVVSEGSVLGLLVDGESVGSAAAGSDVEVVLSRTPFYAEGGGQLADAGVIELSDGTIIEVSDVQAPVGGLVVHRGRVVAGEAVRGADAVGRVDLQRRHAISRAHTATHLVHKGFREALGETATQAGSENAPGRFRFDFSSTGAVPPSVLRDVEATVNDVLAADLAVTAEIMTQEQARSIGAMALFGEKYGDQVRVVSVGDWARELCGGTHATRSSQVGVIKLLGESSIGSGVRRVEALVGADAYRFLAREHLLVHQLSTMLKARPEELPERVEGMLARLKDADRELAAVHAERLRAQIGQIADQAQDVSGVSLLTFAAPVGTAGGDLRQIVVDARGALPSDRPSVVVGLAEADGKVAAVAAVNDAARSAGHSAQVLLRAALEQVGGRGGGKDDLAQGGGSDPLGIPAALEAVSGAVRAHAGV
jgi:alanyl-tRNA synthetase